ncbi:hypothetical protein RZS08_47470, partial [Arthrospira platensis SPKY1]|nr:hypothetical protein [Arthrospira platensis SPKY1]
VEELSASDIAPGQQLQSIEIKISGVLSLPECPDEDPDCLDALNPITYVLTYTDEEGEEYVFESIINYNTWSDDPADFQIEFTPGLPTGLLTIVSFEEITIDDSGEEPVT